MAQDDEQSSSRRREVAAAPLLKVNTWWNLYFAEGRDPLRRGGVSVNAVKVVRLSEQHASWVQIAYPASHDEHLSILKPAARAWENEDVRGEAALAEWEAKVTEWRVIWVNLAHVVYISEAGQPKITEPVSSGG